MESPATATFACPSCGKKLKWKPTIAGKSGRCSCGTSFRAPMAAPSVDSEHYGLSPPPLPAAAVATAGVAMSPPPLPASSSTNTIGYQASPAIPDMPTESDFVDPRRDIYVPLGVLAVGLVAVLGVLGYEGHFSGGAVLGTLFLCGAAMVVKTSILVFVAMSIASSSGGTVGSPMAFTLKVAGLVVVLDAATLWTWDAMVATGAITSNGHFYVVKTFMVMFFVTLVVAAIIVQLLYGLHDQEANLFNTYIAFGNLVLNATILIVLAVALGAVKQARQAAAAAAQQATAAAQQAIQQSQAPQGSTSPPAAPGIPQAPEDHAIAREIGHGDPIVFEGRDWEKVTLLLRSDKPICGMIDHLYDAGAQKVYIDNVGMMPELNRKPGPKAYVELPADKTQRNALINVAHEYQKQVGLAVTPPDDSGLGKYLVIDLKRDFSN